MAYHRTLPHANDRSGLIIMTSIFFLTGIFAVLLRFYSRRLTKVPLGPDDWFALSSLLFVIALNGIFLSGTIQGAITGHSIVIDNWPQPSALETLVQKYKYAFQTTEKIAFGLIKLSILFLWKRMLSPIRSFQLFCWVMIVIVAAWSISFFFATLFQCGTHWDWNWAPIGFFLTECTDTLNMLTVFCGTDLLTDFVIMFMPVPIIWKLQMSVKKKVGVTSVFMVGIFTIGAGVARTYIYLVTSYDKEDNPDFIADFTLFILWSEIEVNVAMIVCCMPVFGPVLGQCRDTLYRRFGRSKEGEFGLLGHSTSASTNDGKTPLTNFNASCGSYAHRDQGYEAKPDGLWVGKPRT
ncbi:hypothetical protein N7472_002014 [Penicillium cf. griseofulvum]|uniref:Rhodopsin domain-containing protein n=1 Tax=Penicillium cf. griseofulvum TaxID=2972120 RepID=A0A9W9T1B0_9EURO|nr:hypothetical protein N7472_002014 [Penicillium cf. griseofulvum]